MTAQMPNEAQVMGVERGTVRGVLEEKSRHIFADWFSLALLAAAAAVVALAGVAVRVV